MGAHRITDFNVHVVRIPSRAVHSHGCGDVGSIDSVLLELRTDSGFTGWGEGSPWPAFTGTVEAAASALDTHLRPHVIGADPVQNVQIMFRADRILVGQNEAKAALECALLDLTGKISGLSVSELLGGRSRESIPLSVSAANRDFAEDLAKLERIWSDGVRIFKVKTGFKDHAFDIMRFEELRKLFGDGVRLRADYNQGLPAYDAIRRIRDLETFRLDFVEQPVRRREREALKHISQNVDVPIMADESVFDSVDALDAASRRIADIFSLKINKSGGMREALNVAAIARAAGIEVYGGCMFETSIAHAAGAHLMAAVPELTLGCEFYMSTYFAEEDIVAEPFPVRDGQVRVPAGPGIGVEPDADRLRRRRVHLLTGS